MLVVDSIKRTIAVPDEDALFGVTSDEKTQVKRFQCPRYTGNGLDLADFSIRINYINAGHETDQYIVRDVKVNGDVLEFSWELNRHVTLYKGTIQFIVCAVRTDDQGAIQNEWNTTYATGEVLQGIEVDGSSYDTETADAIDSILLKVNDRINTLLSQLPEDYQDLLNKISATKDEVSEDLGSVRLKISGMASKLFEETGQAYPASNIKLNTGVSRSSGRDFESYGRMATLILGGAYPCDAIAVEGDYRVRVLGYERATVEEGSYIGCTVFESSKGNIYIKPDEWKYIRLAVSRNPADDTPFLAEDAQALAAAIKLLKFSVDDKIDAVQTYVDERTQLESEEVKNTFTYGGLLDGKNNNAAKNRLRLVQVNSVSGGFAVGKGTRFTIENGYKFGISRFEKYYKNGDKRNVLIGSVSMGSTQEYIAPGDEIWRIHIGRNDNAELWKESDGIKTLTDEGAAALEAYSFQQAPQAITTVVEELIQNMPTDVESLTHDMPFDAKGYHALYDDMVAAGWLTRSAASYPVGGDTEYPMYTYHLEANKGYLDRDYMPVFGDEPYARPKILITSGFHGNERGTPSYLYELIKSMQTDPKYAAMAVMYDWTFVPLVNPWGYSHTLIDSDGAVDYGSLKENYYGYTFVKNSTEYHRGFRGNKDKKDINRDWHDGAGGFPTMEAQYVRSELFKAGVQYDVIIDMHQAKVSDKGQENICGFISMSLKPSSMPQEEYDEKERAVFKLIAKAGIETDRIMSDAVNKDTTEQTAFVWKGTTGATFRNYCGGYNPSGRKIDFDKNPRYALCLETSTTCQAYSDTAKVHDNEIANQYGNTLAHKFIQKLLDK